MSLIYEEKTCFSSVEASVRDTSSPTSSNNLHEVITAPVDNSYDEASTKVPNLALEKVPASQGVAEENCESFETQTPVAKCNIQETIINVVINEGTCCLNDGTQAEGIHQDSTIQSEFEVGSSGNHQDLYEDADITSLQSENSSISDEKLDSAHQNIIKEQNINKIDKNDVKMLSTNNLLEDVNKNITMCKSALSKSAENLLLSEQNSDPPSSSSSENIDADKILNQFNNQKVKVAVNNKVIDNHQPSLPIDSRYTRLPKEILNQDLGNIVKNVHGLFSSVSGGFKYAYNYSSQKHPPKVNTTKIVTGTKLMNEIFEETDDIAEPNCTEEDKARISSSNETNDHIPASIDQSNEDKTSEGANMEKDEVNLHEKIRKQLEEINSKDQIIKELEGKVELLRRRTEQAERDKDAAVMRYATSECAIIEARKAAEAATKAERAAIAETELLQNKIKSAVREKQRICQMYDDKCHELSNSDREISKVREDIKELEGRLKWTQSKLRMEMDAYKECSERAEKLTAQVSELEAMKNEAIANANGAAKAKHLESELKESQAALILLRHERDELDRRARETATQLDTCRRERDEARQALETATSEVCRLSECNLRLEEEAAELAALRAQAALADTLATQVQLLESRVAAAEHLASVEAARAETCARRERDALTHAHTLTQEHITRTHHRTDTHNKIQALSADNTSLRERVTSLEGEVTSLQTALTEETDRRNKENRVLARKVAELTEELEDCNKKLEWEKGENEVLKKKHANAIKELNRELQRALKRCEQLEAKVIQNEPNHSRAGSISSLSSIEANSTSSVQTQNEDRLTNGHHDGTLPDVQVKEPDRQALIERIVSLQRAAARRAERCEFLEEHSRQLTKELRNKTRILRQFLLTAPNGSVTDSTRDLHKAEMARLGGGAMAALWGGAKDGLTLDLSLEINSRLQALLEDTLLKNITLKENMDTLGKEIERLKEKQDGGGNS